jgi:hypothetical protein
LLRTIFAFIARNNESPASTVTLLDLGRIFEDFLSPFAGFFPFRSSALELIVALISYHEFRRFHSRNTGDSHRLSNCWSSKRLCLNHSFSDREQLTTAALPPLAFGLDARE